MNLESLGFPKQVYSEKNCFISIDTYIERNYGEKSISASTFILALKLGNEGEACCFDGD